MGSWPIYILFIGPHILYVTMLLLFLTDLGPGSLINVITIKAPAAAAAASNIFLPTPVILFSQKNKNSLECCVLPF